MNEKLTNILIEVFDIKISEINENLINEDVSSWDSLTQMDLVTTLENEFNIQLEMLEIVSLVSVRKIIEVLESKGINFEN
jgi:acyl carrier protein